MFSDFKFLLGLEPEKVGCNLRKEIWRTNKHRWNWYGRQE